MNYLSETDLAILKDKGITQQQLENQLKCFETGFPYLRLNSAATVGDGITRLTADDEEQAIARWNRYLLDGGDVAKFVPASGAASRMFKALFAFADGDTDIPLPGSDVEKLIKGINNLAFIGELNDAVKRLYGLDVEQLIAAGRNRNLIAAIIRQEGMNYGNLPKGLLTFHRYADGSTRTPLEEQLVEGAQTATSADGTVKLHFTVSGNHTELFNNKIAQAVPAIEKRLGVKFDISMSEQSPATDTIAVNPDNTIFREEGKPVFRPGGHGALIRNLNDLDSTVVFIKNIDNVVPDSRREATIRYKKVLAGMLIEAHDRIDLYTRMLNSGNYNDADMQMMKEFLCHTLSVSDKRLDTLAGQNLASYLAAKFDRPLRVCGMVRNEGEPGGGPFIARNSDGSYSPQILESTQIDQSDPESKTMAACATHFNPVDLVCYIRDCNGQKYDLPAHVDPQTGFISSKSLHGRDLKALELPGLWNGAMSDWNTIFVEVPVTTFNPVKTVNDLLRQAHQG